MILDLYQNDICPECGSELTAYTYFESRGEHFGVPVSEELVELNCECCGWSDSDC